MIADIKALIQTGLTAFADHAVPLHDSAKQLLNTLGYKSERALQLTPNNYKVFAEQFAVSQGNFNPDNAKTKDWQSIDIIFQITQDDIRKTQSLFQARQVDNKIIESYLFFALSLKGDAYSRSDLVRVTREINNLTPMPAMILFRYNNYLTISVIDRRQHKREASKDVLEKVTLIKDINIQKPHRAHIEILCDLSLQSLIDKYSISNFVELHNAWQKTLDTKELNKKFYRELANWYFWAVDNVEFPDDEVKDKGIRNATNLIRLITRIIFIWFRRAKGLVYTLYIACKQTAGAGAKITFHKWENTPLYPLLIEGRKAPTPLPLKKWSMPFTVLHRRRLQLWRGIDKNSDAIKGIIRYN